jgi:6-pyruvoyltetrahydropterin/6-carboxytetrahydropterin synthase
MGKFQSTKIFDNYSIAIRQHKAQHSHCKLLHGYALEFKVWFESNSPDDEKEGLDDMNWIVDFGGFKDKPIGNGLKAWMDHMFDHTVLIEKDDPYADVFEQMGPMGLAKVHLVDRIGAESMAKLVFEKFNDVLSKTDGARCKVVKVECNENKKNSAIYCEKYFTIYNPK